MAAVAGCPFKLRQSAAADDGGQHRGQGPPRGGWRKRGEYNQAIGRSRGGRTTKIHALADGQGRLYALLLTPGQTPDIYGASILIGMVPPPGNLLGDTAYDGNQFRKALAEQGTHAVIRPMRHRRQPAPFDRLAYRQRNIIERAFCRIKDWRAIATRYDKTARNFLAALSLVVAVTQWVS